MMPPVLAALNLNRASHGTRGPQDLTAPGKTLPRPNLPASGAAAATASANPVLAPGKEMDDLRREYGKLQQAVYEAAQIQRKLCAPREYNWGEYEVAGEIFPVRHLSGDFFKVMQLDSALGLVVGDIAGKGLSAGIWQAHFMDLIQRCAKAHARPADVVAEVNRQLCQNPSEPPITALFFARLDSDRDELAYCNAGLPAPLLVRRNNSVEKLDEGGPMLGALRDAKYNSAAVRLNPGDMLLAYSDGLTECRNPQDQEFETTRLSTAATALNGATANQVLFSTLGAVLDFADACPPADDLTLLVVRRRERSASRSADSDQDFSGTLRGLPSVPPPKKAARRVNHSK